MAAHRFMLMGFRIYSLFGIAVARGGVCAGAAKRWQQQTDTQQHRCVNR